jgi:hypothetical protein
MPDNMADNETFDREEAVRAGMASLRQARQLAVASSAATSPPAIEATLAQISDEVMNDAIARRERDAAATNSKTSNRS